MCYLKVNLDSGLLLTVKIKNSSILYNFTSDMRSISSSNSGSNYTRAGHPLPLNIEPQDMNTVYALTFADCLFSRFSHFFPAVCDVIA